MKNSNNKLIIYRRRLIKRKHNPSTYKLILVSNSGTKEIAINNHKSPQPIIKPKGIYQPNNIIDDYTAVLLTINTPQNVTVKDSKLPQYISRYNNQFLYYTNFKNMENKNKNKNLVNNND